MISQIRHLIRSRLSLKLFLGIIPTICFLVVALYVFSVPFIKRTVFELEEHAGRAVLDTVYELASRIHLNLERQRELTLEAHKMRLKNLIEITSGYIDSITDEVRSGEMSPEEARRKLYSTLRRFQYGNNDYIWLADYNARLVSHPDPKRHGKFAVDELDQDGQPVLPTIVAAARTQGEGYYRYSWSRLGEDEAIPKISYFKDFPEWQFVVGTGVYLDDVERDVQKRKAAEVEDLRAALRDITIGRTGYLYIFDSEYRMVIHPNPNIEGTYFGELIDPITRKPIGSELVKIADTNEGRFYKWDKPDDPGNYVYDKISWVRHFDAFDWYVASSAYVSEFKEGSDLLGNRILLISIAFLGGSLVLSYLFVRRITGPIRHLARTAERVQGGDLSARSGLPGNDEIATLSNAFDSMVVRLRDNIHNLDATVHERTSELEDSNRRLTKTVETLERVRRDLAQAELRQRVILDAIPACVAQVDERFRILFVNQRYADLFGRPKDELIGQSLGRLSDWEEQADIMAKLAEAKAGRAVTDTRAWRKATGRDLILKTTIMPAGSGPDEAGLFVLALDVTEEKEAEKRLLEMQRLSAVAQLAAGLTHDFNNLLSIILGNLSCVEERYPDVAGLDDYLEPAMRATRRGADIMGRLLAFARSQPLAPTPIDASKLLQSMMTLLRRSLPTTIELDLEHGGSGWIFADEVQLENAIINLALNAKDAMPDGGRLRLALVRRHASDRPGSDPETPATGFIEIKVSDTGHGFSAEARARAFEPFFTTKKSGAGSGLGLSMVFGFVKQSGGYIEIESLEGRGSTVTIALPVASSTQTASSEPEAGSTTSATWTGKLALVVEDEAEVRDIVRRQLVELGFSVLECVDADEADQLVHHVDDLFLIVSDVVVPGALSGLDFAERALIVHPQVVIVMMTGFVSDEDVAARHERPLTMLRKPFDKRALRNAIARASRTTGPSHRETV